MSRFVFFQQIVGLVQNFYVGSSLGDLKTLSLFPKDRKTHDFPRIQRLHCAASAALALPTPPPNCPPSPHCCRAASAALPTLPPRCHRRRRAAAAATALPPLLLPPCHPASPLLITTVAALPPPPLCCQRLRRAACHRRAAAALPPPLCQHCHRAPAANTALQMPSLVQHDLFPRLCHLVPSPF